MRDGTPFDAAFVLGAGAVGSFLGARLSRVLPVTLVGRAAHVDAINRHGLRLTGQLDETVSVGAATELPDVPARALVIVAVKLRAVPEAAELLARRARDDTVILTVQNGLDADERVRRELARCGHAGLVVVRMLTSCGCNLVRPGEVEYWGGGVTSPDSERAAPVADL
ncbi:unnamed protein product, partial [marine sediment metagenome]